MDWVALMNEIDKDKSPAASLGFWLGIIASIIIALLSIYVYGFM